MQFACKTASDSQIMRGSVVIPVSAQRVVTVIVCSTQQNSDAYRAHQKPENQQHKRNELNKRELSIGHSIALIKHARNDTDKLTMTKMGRKVEVRFIGRSQSTSEHLKANFE